MLGLEVNSVALMDALKDPNAMLATLENMVRSGETPTFDLISMIRKIIDEQVMPGITSTHVASALDTTEFLNAFKLCNNESKTGEADIANSTEKDVDKSRSLHATCRDVEKMLHGHNLSHPESYCVRLGNFLHDADPLRIPDGSTRDDAVAYVKSANDANICDCSEVTQLDDLCTGKEEDLKNKTAECLTKQVSFEADFCNWKIELEANCEALDVCYLAALSAYNDHVNKTRPLVEKWNLETAALHKVLCYCDVWTSDTDERDGRTAHNATHFDVCLNKSHVPDERDYGTPPEKVACLLTSVDNHPGTPGFETQEYSSFTDFVESPVSCTQGVTAAPTS